MESQCDSTTGASEKQQVGLRGTRPVKWSAGNRTWVLWKNSQGSTSEPFSAPILLLNTNTKHLRKRDNFFIHLFILHPRRSLPHMLPPDALSLLHLCPGKGRSPKSVNKTQHIKLQ